MRPALLVALVALVFAPVAEAQTRVDLFDKKSNRTGSATIDEKSGRIDTHDAQSNRTGYGQVDRSTGKVDFYDLRGCQRAPKCPQPWASKIPHPRVHSVASAGRTRPALSLSLSR